MNKLTPFEEKHLAKFKQLAEITRYKKELETQEKEIKGMLEIAMENHGIASIDNDIIRINYIAGSESVAFDTKAFLTSEPDLYHELEQKYNKRSVRKPYIKFTVK